MIAFSELGCKLFKSSFEPILFIPGDIFDPAFLSISQPARFVPESAIPDFQTLRSLNDLRGHVGIIHASKLFHLFDEQKQLELARALGGLLSCEPGSTICGTHSIALEKGIVHHTVLGIDISCFCHSRETWMSLWDGIVFKKGEVKVETTTSTVDVGGVTFRLLHWSVTRLWGFCPFTEEHVYLHKYTTRTSLDHYLLLTLLLSSIYPTIARNNTLALATITRSLMHRQLMSVCTFSESTWKTANNEWISSQNPQEHSDPFWPTPSAPSSSAGVPTSASNDCYYSSSVV